MSNYRRVLVITVVHHPLDARIRQRQINALLDAGWQVTYAAPWGGYGLRIQPSSPGLTSVEVTRAYGRRRLAAQRSARRVLQELGPGHDIILLHDPELVPTIVGLDLPPVVWDVHEDTAAALQMRAWVPRAVRSPLAAAVRWMERRAERRMPLLLADARYAERFDREHTVIPNVAQVPESPAEAAVQEGDRYRVVYLGSVTMERGAAEMVLAARLTHERFPGRVQFEIIGPAHGSAASLLEEARRAGEITWTGFVPNEAALTRIPGALAGLSLLHDQPNFRPSTPTKIMEYLAHGVPVITTPLPVAVDLVDRSGGGVVVPFGTVTQVAERVVGQLSEWLHDPSLAVEAGRAGHRLMREEADWNVIGAEFVGAIAALAEPTK